MKDMDLYGRTGEVRTIAADHIEVRRAGEREGRLSETDRLKAPYDDPLHYLAAVIRGDIQEEDSVSSLKTNLTVSEILDAARRSAQSGKTVMLPLSAENSR